MRARDGVRRTGAREARGRPSNLNVCLKDRGLNVSPDAMYEAIERWSTGSPMLDAALGGGFPKGRIMTITGDESSGKSSITMIMAGAVIRAGGRVAVIDVEGTTDYAWAYRLGVNDISRPNFMVLSDFKNGEQALDAMMDIIDTPNHDEYGEVIDGAYYDLIIYDSTGATVSQDEIDMSAGDSSVAIMARKYTPFFKAASLKLMDSGATLLVVNHKQTLIGADKWAKNWYESGGRKLQYLKSIGIELLTERRLKDGEDIKAHIFRGKVSKNKTTPPHKSFEVRVNVGETGYGLDFFAELAGWAADIAAGRSKAHPGLLKQFNLLQNKEGDVYSAGHIYFEGQPVEFPVKGAMAHAKSKAELVIALKQNPDFRRKALERLYEAIEHANSYEAIRETLKAQDSAWMDLDEAPPEEDEDAVLMEALLQMSDEDRQDALRTYAIRLADKFADV